MAKDKQKKPRPPKYAEKVVIKTTFDETMKLFAEIANKSHKPKDNNTSPLEQE